MNKISLSIIVPHYNDESSLYRLIATIPDSENIQVIIVDDCTYADDAILTNSICELNRKNVELYFNDLSRYPKGAGSCRNIGLTHARGEWLIFSDADDYFTDNAFDIIGDVVDNDADVIYFRPTAWNEDRNEKSMRSQFYEKLIDDYCSKSDVENEEELRYIWAPPWSKMVRSRIVVDNNIAFQETMHSNDELFSAKIGYYASKVEVNNNTIYCIVEKKGTLTRTINSKSFIERFSVCCDKYLFLKGKTSFYTIIKSVGILPYGFYARALLYGYGWNVVKELHEIVKKKKLSVGLFRIEWIKYLKWAKTHY